MKKYETIIFDLDGTLLDTLEDLYNSSNYTLRKYNYPERTLQEIRKFVGNGLAKLTELIIPDGLNNPNYTSALATLKAHYAEHSKVKTKPYDGILELLQELNKREYKMAVVSNKPDTAVKPLIKEYFGDLIPVAIGDKPNANRKPAPDSVFEAMKQLNAKHESSVYIGDSEVDLKTAQNAGLDCITVTWGFRDRDFLVENGGKIFADKPLDVLNLV